MYQWYHVMVAMWARHFRTSIDSSSFRRDIAFYHWILLDTTIIALNLEYHDDTDSTPYVLPRWSCC